MLIFHWLYKGLRTNKLLWLQRGGASDLRTAATATFVSQMLQNQWFKQYFVRAPRRELATSFPPALSTSQNPIEQALFGELLAPA